MKIVKFFKKILGISNLKPTIVIYHDSRGEYRFRAISTNNKIVASSEGYINKKSCEKGIRALKKIMKKGIIIEK